MNSKERAHRYAKQMNIQRLKAANACIRFLSYRSKLKEDELRNELTEEDLATIKEANEMMVQLIKRMEPFCKKSYQ